ncbi:MAG: sulfotransferase family 2 domain-containing protein [Rhodospirillales bacterium]|nr:sulfotransferase family 2 domain-containing protein [Rhodospirillales bacterium]
MEMDEDTIGVQPPSVTKPKVIERVRKYTNVAKKILNGLRDLDGYRETKKIDALHNLAEELLEFAPTITHRAVARELRDSLFYGELDRALRMTMTASRKPDLRAEKIVSRKYAFLWLCIPKVASRSIKSLLCEIDEDAELIVGKSVSEVLAAYPEARAYYSFAFVRDPCRRAFSFYADKYLKPEEKKRQYFIDPYYGTAPSFDFYDLCRWLNTPYGSDAFADRHWLSQTRQLELDEGRLPDFVGRHESLDADFRSVCERLGMPVRSLPKLNTMVGCKPTEEDLRSVAQLPDRHLNETNVTLLQERYADDFALLDRLRERR